MDSGERSSVAAVVAVDSCLGGCFRNQSSMTVVALSSSCASRSYRAHSFVRRALLPQTHLFPN